MDNTLQTNEEIEGIDTGDEISLGDYPIDTVLIRPETRTVQDIMRRIDKGAFIMDPDFQREFIWPEDKQSKLIESVLMRIPLPVFYLAENSEGRMIVVDGLQRLSTFQRFVHNEFALTFKSEEGWQKNELDKKTFSQLPVKLQNRIEDCNLIIYIIDAKVPPQAMLDIFERVNGGMPLTRQQMRNCLYAGPATRFLKTTAASGEFLETVGGRNSLDHKKMRDREFINRFCAFHLLGIEEYRGAMDNFLAKTLERMNGMDETELGRLQEQFCTSMVNNKAVFGINAFRKPPTSGQQRKPINAALWDILSTGLSRYDTPVVESHADALRDGLYQLLKNPTFEDSVTYATNNIKQVKHRFDCMQNLLDEIF